MRPLLIVLAAAIILGTAYHALSSPQTTEQPTFRLSKPKSKDTCILKMTAQRFLIRSDGRMEYAGGFTIWTACDR